MTVVADTTPLCYLVLIGRESLIPLLYGRVVIPPAVAAELGHENTPGDVRAWLAGEPDWLEVREPTKRLGLDVDLDRGEREAVALAEELSADLLLVDDWDARQEARRRALPIAGTLRVLTDGAAAGLSDLEADFELEEHRRSIAK